MQRIIGPQQQYGATLVELVTVIAILAAVLSVAFPLVETSREASRRHSCYANLKQIMHGMICHNETQRVFPSGGVVPWPRLEDNLDGAGRPYGPRDQGLGWAYQIAPFVDENLRDIHLVMDTQELAATPVPVYFCPSRRAPTSNAFSQGFYIDYAAAIPNRSRTQMGDSSFEVYLDRGCGRPDFWGGDTGHFNPRPAEALGDRFTGFWGVVVRSDLLPPAFAQRRLGYYQPISHAQITDGMTRTLVVSEKWVSVDNYQTSSWHDDRGWTDGYDPDLLRSTICASIRDVEPGSAGFGDDGYRFGSAHPRGFNAAFADGSVRTIHYDIDLELFNRLGHRSDSELVSP